MESLSSLNNYTAAHFEMWLYDQLRLIHAGTSEEKYRACDFRALGVSRGESYIDSLSNLFKILNKDAKKEFRNSLGRLLKYILPSNLPCEAMADIVMLAGITKASKSFAEFAPVLGGSKWGGTHPSLIYDALSVLLMVDPSNEVYKSAKGLSVSKYFNDALVFDAYLIMLKCRPDAWREDFELLSERFDRLTNNVLSSGNEITIERLYKRMDGLTEMAPGVAELFDDLCAERLLGVIG